MDRFSWESVTNICRHFFLLKTHTPPPREKKPIDDTHGSGRILTFTTRSESSSGSYAGGIRADENTPFPPSYASEILIKSYASPAASSDAAVSGYDDDDDDDDDDDAAANRRRR